MSNWLKKGESEYLKEDNEWHLVLLDIADLITNFSKHPITSDSKEYAARAISFCVSHIERSTPELVEAKPPVEPPVKGEI